MTTVSSTAAHCMRLLRLIDMICDCLVTRDFGDVNLMRRPAQVRKERGSREKYPPKFGRESGRYVQSKARSPLGEAASAT